MTHIKVKSRLLRTTAIVSVACERLEKDGMIVVAWEVANDKILTTLTGQEALDFLMKFSPEMLEGKRLKSRRNAWAFHNLVAHPLLQILAWAGHTKLGLKIHDKTIPDIQCS